MGALQLHCNGWGITAKTGTDQLQNSVVSAVCDCGYSLDGRGEDQVVHYLRSIAESVNSIRKMILCWIVLTLVCAAVGGLVIATGNITRDNELHRQMEKGTNGLPK